MERILFTCGLIVLLAICGLVAFNAVRDPLEAKHKWVDEELERIESTVVEFPKPDWDFAKWHKDITGKRALWKEIVPPPPPPPPPKEQPPNLNEKLKDVQPTRAQVGGQVKIKTSSDPKGTFYAVGDRIKGLTIKEITKQYVEFRLLWKDKELTTRLPRK